MLKRHKRGQRNRRKTIFLLLLAIVFMSATGPFVWRAEQLRHAKKDYDIKKVQEELLWFEKYGGLLNNLEMITDTKLWLELNVGSEGVESKLESYLDDKHQFWLYILYLRMGNISAAQTVLDKLGEQKLNILGQGLMLISKGDAQQSRELLGSNDINWSKMQPEEQTLRYLTLAQADLSIGDLQSAQSALEAAQDLSPNNPACLSLAFDLAIKEEQWTKADELSQSIDAQSWRLPNTLYETKKLILAIETGNLLNLDESLLTLKKLPQGDACVNYLKGLLTLKQGDLDEGRILLESALKSGLEGELRSDAQKALNQIIERQQADQTLRAVVAEAGEQW